MCGCDRVGGALGASRHWGVALFLRIVVVPALLLAVFATAGPARAQEKGAPRLSFSAPPGCGSEAAFRDTVAIFFGGADPFDSKAPGVVRVTFTKIPGGYRGAVQYTPPNGAPWPTEEKVGPLCELIYHSVARVASMHVPDPPPKGAPAETQRAPDSTQSEQVDESPVRITSKGLGSWAPPAMARENLQGSNPSPAPRKKVDLAIGLSGFVLMSAGYAADVTPGFQLGAELRSVHEETDVFRMGFEFRGLLPGRAIAREPVDPAKATSPREFDLSQMSVLLVPCLRWKYLVGCGVTEGGMMILQDKLGLGVRPTVRFGPRLGLEVPFAERFAVRAFGEVLFAAVNSGFGYKDPSVPGGDAPNVVWNESIASGFFGAGLSVKFE